MVYINANLDLKSHSLINTTRLNEDLADLSESSLYITLVARDIPFLQEAWKREERSYIRVVLPYEEILADQDTDRLIYQQLFQQLDLLDWLDTAVLKNRLAEKMARLN
ncbi:MAG: hypothetical protein AAF806_10075 [Bacteroidota bacterium]